MSPYQILKNSYIYLLIGLMYKFPGEKDPTNSFSFKFIKTVAAVVWTMLLPLFMTSIVFKLLKKIITDEDKEEALKAASKYMMIYAALSEFEWRNEISIYLRILKNETKNAKDGVIMVPDLGDVLVFCLMGTGHSCNMRQETEEEFVTRNTEGYAHKGDDLQPKTLKQLEETFTQQFQIITNRSKGDIFKEFYLGRKMMFLKINRGNSRKKPRVKEMIPEGV